MASAHTPFGRGGDPGQSRRSVVAFGLEVGDDRAGIEQVVPVVAVEALPPQPVVR